MLVLCASHQTLQTFSDRLLCPWLLPTLGHFLNPVFLV